MKLFEIYFPYNVQLNSEGKTAILLSFSTLFVLLFVFLSIKCKSNDRMIKCKSKLNESNYKWNTLLKKKKAHLSKTSKYLNILILYNAKLNYHTCLRPFSHWCRSGITMMIKKIVSMQQLMNEFINFKRNQVNF